ncbi:hypothetical protein [Maricaulis alexandrii]|uniref:hypothetical protein n=1 Tax=Maricaulis alexandrii TaxID=2570354 RepID=UPI0011089CDE|nr:hypothetical protein [Maricaulis alexandrii]
MPYDRVERTLLMSPEVEAFLNAEVDEFELEKRARLRADLEGFVAGNVVLASLKPLKKSRECFIARVYPEGDGVWCIRCLAPSPGYRIFGAFAKVDVFVALHVVPRDWLGNFLEEHGFISSWRNEVRRTVRWWVRHFHQYEKLKGAELNEFLSRCLDAAR